MNQLSVLASKTHTKFNVMLHPWSICQGASHADHRHARAPVGGDRVTTLGPHMRMVECFPMRTASTLRTVDVVVNAACSDDLGLHSAVLAGQWKHVNVDRRIMQRACAVQT